MNFYKHYIGDFQRDTGHLSLTERGAYLALIHHYYATEKPLPKEHDALCRIAGAFTAPERKAVKVAMGFFEVVESGLMHNRIEAELHKAGEISTTNRDIALAREAKRRDEKAARTSNEPSTKRAQSVPRSLDESSTNAAPPQTPDTRHQEEKKKRSAVAPHLAGIPENLLADFLKVRKAKRAGELTETALRGIEREGAKAQLTVIEAITACVEYGWQSFNAGWYAERHRTRAGPLQATTTKYAGAAAAIFQMDEEVIDV